MPAQFTTFAAVCITADRILFAGCGSADDASGRPDARLYAAANDDGRRAAVILTPES